LIAISVDAQGYLRSALTAHNATSNKPNIFEKADADFAVAEAKGQEELTCDIVGARRQRPYDVPRMSGIEVSQAGKWK
jgi:hypothetical protein